MSRPLKFRFWDKEQNKFVDLQKFGDQICIQYDGSVGWWSHKGFERDVDHFIPSQYTGFKDKDGQEVYDGDIVNWYPYYKFDEEPKAVGQVYTSCFRVCIDKLEGEKSFCGYEGAEWASSELEVIGNQFENPELLEEYNDRRK